MTIIIGFGPVLRVAGPSHPESVEHSFVAGLHPSYAVTTEHGDLEGVQVDLSPLGAYMLFGVGDARDLGPPGGAFDDVLGPEAAELTERLVDAIDWDARFELLDTYIAGGSRPRGRLRRTWPGRAGGCATPVGASR